jgi:hypothetical protein
MLEIYQTLVRMQYLDPEYIIQGPHNVSATISTHPAEINDLFFACIRSILPCVNTGGVMDVDIYDGGEFARFDNSLDVNDSWNPFYAQDKDEMMKPWVSHAAIHDGNHETPIMYSFKNHSICIFSQSGVGSVDPGLGNHSHHGGEADSENESDDAMEQDEYYSNTNCRPAGNVLRDINKWYK